MSSPEDIEGEIPLYVIALAALIAVIPISVIAATVLFFLNRH